MVKKPTKANQRSMAKEIRQDGEGVVNVIVKGRY
jgi:hypothetical protein